MPDPFQFTGVTPEDIAAGAAMFPGQSYLPPPPEQGFGPPPEGGFGSSFSVAPDLPGGEEELRQKLSRMFQTPEGVF